MARKITLTVPDALYGKIDQWRNGFNLSRIFQEAVSEAIRKKEDFQERLNEDHSLQDIISRLKSEKKSWESKISEQAEKAGSLWASKAHYEDLLLAVNTRSEKLFQLPLIEDQIKNTLNQLSDVPESFKSKIQDSWLKGVQSFWLAVRDKI